MSAGQDALREAARLEAALVYGGVRVRTDGPRNVGAAQAEELVSRSQQIRAAISAGLGNDEIMQRYKATYSEVQTARRRVRG